ncbi:hypothetical protein GGF32_005435 [Allomyces javanicus]|nr:hypothetical protein GGF32_005435 [Allomyces javanicus]
MARPLLPVFAVLLLLAVTSAPTAATDAPAFVPTVGARAVFKAGPGSVVALFADMPASGVNPVMFNVLNNKAPKPDKVTVLMIAANDLPAGVDYTYHIHESKVNDAGDCASTGAHWDKAQVNPRFKGGKNEDYKPTQGDWTTYESGDLSGKYGSLNAETANYRKKWVLDPTIQVGDFANLSFTVHGTNGTRVACANMQKIDEAVNWAKLTANPLRAVVSNSQGTGDLAIDIIDVPVTPDMPENIFTVISGQPRPATVAQLTIVARNFTGSTEFKYHIHEAAISGTDCATAKDHWDAAQVNPRFKGGNSADYKPTVGNWTTYETGDLSGKYGSIKADDKQVATTPNTVQLQTAQAQTNVNGQATSATTFRKVVWDPTFTTKQIEKLSIVLHGANGTRVGCANLNYVVAFAPANATNTTSDGTPTSSNGNPSTTEAGKSAASTSAVVSVVGVIAAAIPLAVTLLL